MPDISIRIPDAKALQRAFARSPDLVVSQLTSAISRGAIIVQRWGRAEAPAFESRLRSSIRPRFSHMQAEIGPNAKHSIFVHEGTRPHWAPLERGKGLHKWATRKGLNPYAVRAGIAKKGTKANPFMDRAFEGSQPEVQKEFDQAFDKIVRELANG